MTKRKAGPIDDAEEAQIQAMIARDPDNPDVTPEEVAQARPAAEALDPALFANLIRRGRPPSEASKVLVTLRLPPAVVEGYRATGPGWQVRMGEVLAGGLAPQARAKGRASGTTVYRETGPRGSSLASTVVTERTTSGGVLTERSSSTTSKRPKPKIA